MRHFLYTLTMATVMMASCEKPQYEKMDDPTIPGGVENIDISWDKLADSCTFVLAENFLDKEKGTFWATPQDVSHNSGNIYWQQAHALDVLIYSYERIKDSDPELAATYRDYFKRWFENDGNNYNHSHKADGAHGGFFNAYTDDMCWIGLTLTHLASALEDNSYADVAKAMYDDYIIPRKVNGGGLPWTNMSDKAGQNACTNSPGCLLASKLYLYTNDYKYLEDALALYDFMATKRVSSDYMVENPPLSYTQGTFGEAARTLYHITGDKKYMYMAERVILYAFTSDRCVNNGILRSEGESMDQSIFKAVLIPYGVNYCLDDDATPYIAKRIRSLILSNGFALYESLNRSAYPQMYANYYWGESFKGAIASMGAQTSGASLMENIARMLAE